MHHLILAASLGPPTYDTNPWWYGFWIVLAVILAVVAYVGTIIMMVNRLEWQAAVTSLHLAATKEATDPLQGLAGANNHLRAIARALRAASPGGAGQ
jgi:hypothetical protein